MNKITIELSKEDRELLSALVFDLEKIMGLMQAKNDPQTHEAEPVKGMSHEAEKPQENASQAAPEPIPAPVPQEPTPLPDIGDGSEVPEPHIEAIGTPVAEPFHTHEDVQQMVVRLCAAGKKPEVKEIVNAYAERVSAIPADKLDECMDKLKALEG